MNRVKLLIALVVVGAGLFAGLLQYGAGGSSQSDSGDAETVYVCSETGKTLVGPPQRTPAFNPATGRHTLMRGLYCAQCQQWRAAPPAEAYGGNPLMAACPKHRQAMSPVGPIDESFARLAEEDTP